MPYSDARPAMEQRPRLTLEERQKVGEALDKCTGSFKRMISPLLPYERVLSFLHRELSKCNEESDGSIQEAHLSFALRMEEPGTKQYVEDLLNLMRSESQAYESEMVDDAWITDFQNQVDYVPGLSKGKRLLSAEAAGQYISLGSEMKETGNRAFSEGDFDMALTRYTQGVELLSNVQSRDDDSEKALRALRVTLLTNQAAAGLRTGSFRVAVSACSACLDEDPLNLKARARRAEARKELGEVEAAREDLDFLLRLTEDQLGAGERDKLQAAKRLARREMAELSGLLQQEKRAAQKMMEGSQWGEGRAAESRSRGEEGAAEQQKRVPVPVVESPTVRKDRLVDEETALRMQEDLRRLYESEAVTVQLMQMRRAAEYEEVRFIQRLRPFLIDTVAPVLEAHGLGQGEQGYRHMERAIAQHLTSSALVKQNAKEMLSLLMGDLADA